MIQNIEGKGEDEVQFTPFASLFKPFLSSFSILSKPRLHVRLLLLLPISCFIDENELGSWFLMTLSCLAVFTDGSFWYRLLALFTAIFVARIIVGTVCPITAIAFKWIVTGRYQPGTYQM